jgi:HAD superfamily hydrolase (TIGR01549 family)
MKKFRAVFFDMGGVLMDVLPEFKRENAIRHAFRSGIVRRFFTDSFDMAGFASFVSRAIEESYYNAATEMQQEAWAVIKSSAEAFAGRQIPFAVLRKIFWEYLNFMSRYLFVHQESKPVLEYCKQQSYIIGLISNVFHPSIVYKELLIKWKIFDYFHPLVFSSDFLFKKPSERIFNHALQFHPHLNPAECVFIGDTYEIDIEGAVRSGLNPIWLNDGGKKANQNKYGVPEIHALSELKGIL